jgi:hypothetical protein
MLCNNVKKTALRSMIFVTVSGHFYVSNCDEVLRKLICVVCNWRVGGQHRLWQLGLHQSRLPLNLLHTLLIILLLFSMNITYKTPNIPGFKSHVHFSMLGSFQRVVNPLANPSWRTIPCQLCATRYSMYLQLPSKSRSCLLHLQNC